MRARPVPIRNPTSRGVRAGGFAEEQMGLTKSLGRWVAALCLASAVPAAAQGGAVTGTVVDAASGRPLASANVTLRSLADSARVVRGQTGAEGRFRLPAAAGRWMLQASSIGHAPLRREVDVAAGAPTDVGTLRLATAAVLLEGLEATTERSTVIVAPDRTIYSTRDMPVAQGGVATDVLRSVPELEVDANGGVQLRGSTPAIYVNGRPAPMQGESLEQFLQQFPADRIERIEVIPNPSARFEAEGSGGIVNIVLKTNVDLGLSGSVFTNASSRGDVGGGGRVTFQRGRLTLGGGGFLRRSDRTQESYDLRQNLVTTPVTFLETDGSTDRLGWSGNADASVEYKLTPKSTVWAEGSLWSNDGDNEGVTLYTEMDAQRVPTERYSRSQAGEASSLNTSVGGGLRHAFAPEGHELTVELRYEDGRDDNRTRVLRRLLDADGNPTADPAELTVDELDEGERETQLEAAYVRPWTEGGSVEIGYRAEVQHSDEDRRLAVLPGGTGGTMEFSGFGFREVFHSAFATVSRTFGPLQAQVGLRAEHASTRLDVVGEDERFEKDYLSWFPSANLRFDAGGGREVRLSYSRRLRRPGPWVLSPVDRSNDPLNRNVGNPDIEPQFAHSFSLETSWTGTYGTVRLSPHYRRTENEWVQIRRVDAQGVSTNRWENLATVESYGTSLTASLRPLRGISGSLSLSGSREVRDAGNLSEEYSGDAMRWNIRANGSAKVTETLAVQGMVFYQPARDVAQGRMSSTVMSHVGLRQQLFDERASLQLSVMDPFDVWRQDFTTRDPTFLQIGRSRWSARTATISFSWAFGRPPRQQRGRQTQPEEGDEVPGQQQGPQGT